ncbi:MAG: Large-conductance mechanosensitive channel [Candidatus Acidoferrum typicum]|nr:Large-conductance mechanosensitive channel [Candidatus Acidoferrum typicum]
MFKEFKEFALRGNVIDLAVGVIIGAAFGKIVSSLVQDLIMPPIGMLLKGVNFSNLFIALDGRHFDNLQDAQKAGAPTLNYGIFLNNVLDFMIVAFCVFLLVQQVNRWTRKPEPAAAPATKECPQCAMSIPIQAKRCPHCTTQIG